VYLREDAVSGMSYLENQSEVRAPTADVAARLLDAAIASRTVPRESCPGFFTARRCREMGAYGCNSVRLFSHPANTFVQPVIIPAVADA